VERNGLKRLGHRVSRKVRMPTPPIALGESWMSDARRPGVVWPVPITTSRAASIKDDIGGG
jgi:hypothetical protein